MWRFQSKPFSQKKPQKKQSKMKNFRKFFMKNKAVAGPKLYTTCNTLPIHNFNEIMNNQDLNYLKINRDDKVSNSDLENAWLNLMDEYFTLTNNPKALHQLKNKMHIMILEKKIHVLEILKYCIAREINVDEEMKIYRVTKQNLPQHLGLLKNDLLKKLAAIPEEINNADNEFDKTIAVLMSRGFSVNRFKTVVSEWVAMLEIVEKQNKAQQQ